MATLPGTLYPYSHLPGLECEACCPVSSFLSGTLQLESQSHPVSLLYRVHVLLVGRGEGPKDKVRWSRPTETPHNWLFASLFQHSSVGPLIQTYLSPGPGSNPLFPAAVFQEDEVAVPLVQANLPQKHLAVGPRRSLTLVLAHAEAGQISGGLQPHHIIQVRKFGCPRKILPSTWTPRSWPEVSFGLLRWIGSWTLLPSTSSCCPPSRCTPP